MIVIGAGPAGISAALRAKEKGLACVVLEQATVAASIKSFPRDKIVHDPPLNLPVEGELWLERATKEDLLAQWTRIVRARGLDVREGHRVVDIARVAREQISRVTTSQAATFEGARRHSGDWPSRHAAKARGGDRSGRRESRRLRARGCAELRRRSSSSGSATARWRPRSRACPPAWHQRHRDLHRGKSFARGKAKNIRQLEALAAEKKVKLLLETQPVSVTTTGVVLEGTGPHKGRRTIPADSVIVLIGGVPSWDLLTKAGITRPG